MAAGTGDEWDDIEAEALARQGATAPGASRAVAPPPPASGSAYAGGGIGGFDDDDPFADAGPAGGLELDLPSHHQAHARSLPAGPPSSPPSHRPQGGGSLPPLQSQPPASGQAHASSPLSGRPSAPASQPRLPAISAPPPSDPRLRASAPAGPLAPSGSLPPTSGPTSIQPQYPVGAADPASLIARFPPPPAKVHETPLYAVQVMLRQLELRQDLASLRRRRSPDVPLYERALHTYDARTFRLGLVIGGAIASVASFLFFLPVLLRFLRAD